MREVICIVCPKGCHLHVSQNAETGEYEVRGATCDRGMDYGIKEVTNPVRVLTSFLFLSVFSSLPGLSHSRQYFFSHWISW